jgi:hypothetical protein
MAERSGTVLTCFPSGGRQYNGPNGEFADIYSCISSDLYDYRVGSPRTFHYEDAYDLAALLCTESIAMTFERNNKKFADLLGIYQWAIRNKVIKRHLKL